MKQVAETILIVGVGLIGGSLGKAIKKRRLAKQVIGVSRKQATLRAAKKAGAIDVGSTQLEKMVPKADIIVIAAPLDKVIPLAKKIAKLKKPDAVVTDVGSVKGKILTSCEPFFNGTFVGGHPMAGSEKTGVAFAKEKLFEDTVCILTPTKKTQSSAKRKVEQLWKGVGAKVSLLSAKEHDNVTAYISHLPHLLSVALVQSLPLKQRNYLKFIGTGFKDMSRLAGGDSKLWLEILLSNKSEVQKSLNQNIKELQKWKRLLETENQQAVLSQLQQARSTRRKIK